MKKSIIISLMLLIILLTGCTTEFESNIYGSWITEHKIKINDIREPEYEYIVFLPNGKYQTNIFEHLFVEGQFFLKQENDDYFFQLEYKSNTTFFQYTFTDETYQTLRIKNDKDIVKVFHREKN